MHTTWDPIKESTSRIDRVDITQLRLRQNGQFCCLDSGRDTNSDVYITMKLASQDPTKTYPYESL